MQALAEASSAGGCLYTSPNIHDGKVRCEKGLGKPSKTGRIKCYLQLFQIGI